MSLLSKHRCSRTRPLREGRRGLPLVPGLSVGTSLRAAAQPLHDAVASALDHLREGRPLIVSPTWLRQARLRRGRSPPSSAHAPASRGGNLPKYLYRSEAHARRRRDRHRPGNSRCHRLVAGHSGYAQPPVSVLPALMKPPSQLPYNGVPCVKPSARPRCVSEACHAAAPHAAGTKAAACSRRHRWRRPCARRAHLAARPVHVTGCSCGGAAQRPREAARVVVDLARRLAAL
jgi:hypothetical protein